LADDLKASMGLWPFACNTCGRRFTANRRYVPASPYPEANPLTDQRRTEASHSGPEMAFRRDAVKPTAKVIIQADDTVQLDQILIALHRAVSSCQQPAREQSGANSH
jgi:hypothetical protein